MTTEEEPGWLQIRNAIHGCDYRLSPTAHERTDGCNCESICFLKKGTFRDHPERVDYGTCVECMTAPCVWIVDPKSDCLGCGSDQKN